MVVSKRSLGCLLLGLGLGQGSSPVAAVPLAPLGRAEHVGGEKLQNMSVEDVKVRATNVRGVLIIIIIIIKRRSGINPIPPTVIDRD